MIPGITEINFPSYATLHQATASFEEMGDRTITTQVKIDGDIVPDFKSSEWALMYRGEKFILDTHTPQATKDESSRDSLIDLTFTSYPISELKRYFFFEYSEETLGTMIINKYIASLRLNAQNFITAFNRVLSYYFDGLFSIEVAEGATLSEDVKEVSIEYSYLWDVLSSVYDEYGLSWRIVEEKSKYIIRVGESTEKIPDHVFSYGYKGGLSSIERQIEDSEIYNQLLGRGGETNLPYRYFKKEDPNNTAFSGDPDACAELANVYFERLLDINFRYYVKGWLRNPNRPASTDYPVPSEEESAEIRAHWAYQKGLTDEKFQPVEYVQDEKSIEEYGIRQGKLDDDDDIYPTIQGITVDPYGRVDEVVAVGEITDGDDSGATSEKSLGSIVEKHTFEPDSLDSVRTYTFMSDAFEVPVDRSGEIRYKSWYVQLDPTIAPEPEYASAVVSVNTSYSSVVAIRQSDSKEFPISTLPGGYTYKLRIKAAINAYPTNKALPCYVGLTAVRVMYPLPTSDGNPYAFNIWLKNLWQSEQGSDESDLVYAKRIWEPILGDRLGDEAKITFSDGWMSASSDYEFTIVDWPAADRSKSLNGVSSEWRLTLAKSDAEYETTGKYIPNSTSPQPVAGDHIYFTGIDMPHLYVLWGEKRVNEAKQMALNSKAYANPTWAIQLDPIRINTIEGEEDGTLMSKLRTGITVDIYDPRFSGGEILQLAVRSMSITWSSETTIYPSVEVVLSEDVLGRTSWKDSLVSESSVVVNVNNAVAKAQSALKISQKSVGGDKNFVFEQSTPSTTWTIEHNLGKRPSVTVVDSAGTAVLGQVTYDTDDPLNKVTVTFSAEFSGTATLN